MATRQKALGAAAGGDAPVEISFRGALNDENTATSYTFAGADIGVDAGSHHVVGLVMIEDRGATGLTLTIGGQSTTVLRLVNSTGSACGLAVFITDAEITATTGDVVVTPSGFTDGAIVGLYDVRNVLDNTASFDNDVTTQGNITITTAEDGAIFALCGADSTPSLAISGDVVEDYDLSTRLFGDRSAGGASLTDGTDDTVNFSIGGESASACVLVSIR